MTAVGELHRRRTVHQGQSLAHSWSSLPPARNVCFIVRKRIAGTVDAQELVCSVRSPTRLAEPEWAEQFEVPMMYAMVVEKYVVACT